MITLSIIGIIALLLLIFLVIAGGLTLFVFGDVIIAILIIGAIIKIARKGKQKKLDK